MKIKSATLITLTVTMFVMLPLVDAVVENCITCVGCDDSNSDSYACRNHTGLANDRNEDSYDFCYKMEIAIPNALTVVTKGCTKTCEEQAGIITVF